eukprot:TRINITY_DN41261_c0_g1_i1.p1 TRINITY_DN41261_c0_g1~~TRINITY_DN41261_c0_g1_i1.p1  ORF type:complete len:263 (-),score=75.78 TRINITY_DN41261_c0_g1_i1:125-913(-)
MSFGYQTSGDFDAVLAQSRSTVSQLNTLVGSLKKSVDVLGTERDTQDFRRKLNALTMKAKGKAKEAGEAVKAVQSHPSGPDEKRNHRMQGDRLRKDFETVLHRFQEITSTSQEKIQQYLPKASANDLQLDDDDGDVMEEERRRKEQRRADLDRRHQQQSMVEADLEQNEALIAEREEGIAQIDTTIHEINDIFKDLATMVHDQGAQLDSIETNLINTDNRVSQASGELTKASDYQKAARRKACYLMLIVLIIGGGFTMYMLK